MKIEWDKAGLDQLQQAVDAASRDIAEDVADDARRYAPVDSGRLRSTIHVAPGERPNTTRVVCGDDDVDYWADQEFGTRYQPGQAFMRPALNKTRNLS